MQTTAPTCTEKGEETEVCSYHSSETRGTRDIAANGHTGGVGTVTDATAYPATSTVTCSVCSDTYTRNTAIGDTGPGGGIIFYVDSDGFTVEGYGNESDEGYFAEYPAHYLEAAPSNHSSTVQWGDHGTLIENGLTTFAQSNPLPEIADKIGNGRKDMQIIVAHMNSKSITNTAAQVAAASTFGSRNDWFLPSCGELNLLYLQRNLTGINITTGIFWSSSQYSNHYAWGQYFASGGRDYGSKNYDGNVRAVRAF